MATLLELAERVEAASGPDRELDREICLALRSGRWISPTAVPRCTASLDAAMMLMPEGWRVTLEIGRGEGYAFVRDPVGSQSGNATADDAALALTAACLRALAKDTPHA